MMRREFGSLLTGLTAMLMRPFKVSAAAAPADDPQVRDDRNP
jgi:hypothetical protein